MNEKIYLWRSIIPTRAQANINWIRIRITNSHARPRNSFTRPRANGEEGLIRIYGVASAVYIYVPTDVTAAHAKVNYYAPGVRAANRNLIGKMKNRAREGKSSAARENSRFSFGERINRCVRARARVRIVRPRRFYSIIRKRPGVIYRAEVAVIFRNFSRVRSEQR